MSCCLKRNVCVKRSTTANWMCRELACEQETFATHCKPVSPTPIKRAMSLTFLVLHPEASKMSANRYRVVQSFNGMPEVQILD